MRRSGRFGEILACPGSPPRRAFAPRQGPIEFGHELRRRNDIDRIAHGDHARCTGLHHGLRERAIGFDLVPGFIRRILVRLGPRFGESRLAGIRNEERNPVSSEKRPNPEAVDELAVVSVSGFSNIRKPCAPVASPFSIRLLKHFAHDVRGPVGSA